MSMASYTKREQDNTEYERLKADLKAGTPRGAYVFYGEERYLLADAVKKLRDMIPAETAEFNHHRMDGRSFSPDAFAEAVDALPVFAERTLIEVNDADFAKLGDETRRAIVQTLRDVPEYACVVFVCPEGAAPDWRAASSKEIASLVTKVEFQRLDEQKLVSWTARRLAASGKKMTRQAAERFVMMTGGLMTNMVTELEKLSAYCAGDTVDVKDVELLVTPVADVKTWKFTDTVLRRRADDAFSLMGELLRMPDMDGYTVIYALAGTVRQLMIARVCAQKRVSVKEFMALAGVRSEYPAKNLMSAAGGVTLSQCVQACRAANETLLRLNSTGEDETGAAKELTARVLLALGVRA